MADTPVDVSVIIVNWNTCDLLLDVIASLQTSTSRVTLEIIVVDNASHDGSAAALQERYPEVTLIQNDENLGFARANNIGFARAAGRAVCLVNTDVIALEGVVDELWDRLQAEPDVAMIGPHTIDGNGATRRNCRRFPSLGNAAGDHLWLKKLGLPGLQGRALPMDTYDETHDAEVLSGCFLMVRRDALDAVGPLDENFFFYGEDTDWGKRFHDAGWRALFHPAATAIHFGGASTAAYPLRYYLNMERADLRYWRKHHPVWQRGIYVAMRLTHNLTAAAGWAAIWAVRPQLREKASLKVRGNLINSVWLVTWQNLV